MSEPQIHAIDLTDAQDRNQAETYPGKRFIAWYCPECNARNVDSPDLTAVPMCGNCGAEFDWWDFPEEVSCNPHSS